MNDSTTKPQDSYFQRILTPANMGSTGMMLLYLAALVGAGIAFSGVIRYMKIAGGAR